MCTVSHVCAVCGCVLSPMQTSITCVSEVSIACVPVCMVVVTPPELGNRSGGGRKAKRDKIEEKLEGDLAVIKKLTKMPRLASKRRPAIVRRTKQTTCSRRHRFSRKVLLRHKHWHW